MDSQTPTDATPEQIAAAEVARQEAAEAQLRAEQGRKVSISAALRLSMAQTATQTVEADGLVWRVTCGRAITGLENVRQRFATVAASQTPSDAPSPELSPAEMVKRGSAYLELCREVVCASVVGVATAIDGIAHNRLPFEAVTVTRQPATAEGFVEIGALSDTALTVIAQRVLATDGRSLAEQIAPFRG